MKLPYIEDYITSISKEGDVWIQYFSNNSGGRPWLKEKDWKNLESAGWIIHWNNKYFSSFKDYPVYGYLKEDNMKVAIDRFEEITGQDSNEEGCHCCGRPHVFEYMVVRKNKKVKNLILEYS